MRKAEKISIVKEFPYPHVIIKDFLDGKKSTQCRDICKKTISCSYYKKAPKKHQIHQHNIHCK